MCVHVFVCVCMCVCVCACACAYVHVVQMHEQCCEECIYKNWCILKTMTWHSDKRFPVIQEKLRLAWGGVRGGVQCGGSGEGWRWR